MLEILNATHTMPSEYMDEIENKIKTTFNRKQTRV